MGMWQGSSPKINRVLVGESLVGDGNDNTLFGNDGNDKISGGDGTDSLAGENGDDVVSGEGGKIILSVCDEVLKNAYPDLAERMTLVLPDEQSRRAGQSVAAASLPVA